MGSPVSPIISNLNMEFFERLALSSFNRIRPYKWFRYIHDTWVLIKNSELDAFFDHINNIDPNIKFTQEGLSNNQLVFLDCSIRVEEDRLLSVSVYLKQTHTDQYLQFDSNHSIIQKLGGVKTYTTGLSRSSPKTLTKPRKINIFVKHSIIVAIKTGPLVKPIHLDFDQINFILKFKLYYRHVVNDMYHDV